MGDEYIVYYIQGLTSPTTAAREGTMVYLRVIIIWGLCEMLNFQYEKTRIYAENMYLIGDTGKMVQICNLLNYVKFFSGLFFCRIFAA